MLYLSNIHYVSLSHTFFPTFWVLLSHSFCVSPDSPLSFYLFISLSLCLLSPLLSCNTFLHFLSLPLSPLLVSLALLPHPLYPSLLSMIVVTFFLFLSFHYYISHTHFPSITLHDSLSMSFCYTLCRIVSAVCVSVFVSVCPLHPPLHRIMTSLSSCPAGNREVLSQYDSDWIDDP